MRPRPALRRPRALVAVALLTLCAAACGGDDGPSGPVPDNEVRVQNNAFSPATRNVSVGTTVIFRWASDAFGHNVTFSDGPASATKTSGTYTRTFNAAGTFGYQCTVHEGMTGTIIVS